MTNFPFSLFLFRALSVALCFMVCCMFFSCSTDPKPRAQKTLIVIAQDLSSSFRENRLEKAQYEHLLSKMMKRHAGDALYTVAIGNIEPKQLVNECHFEAIEKDKPTQDDRRHNKRHNLAKRDTFLHYLEAQLFQYSPLDGKDVTDIDVSLHKINLILNDEAYRNYQKVLLVISDGRHEDALGNAMQMKAVLQAQDVKVLLTGWKSDYSKACFANVKVTELATVKAAYQSIVTMLKEE